MLINRRQDMASNFFKRKEKEENDKTKKTLIDDFVEVVTPSKEVKLEDGEAFSTIYDVKTKTFKQVIIKYDLESGQAKVDRIVNVGDSLGRATLEGKTRLVKELNSQYRKVKK